MTTQKNKNSAATKAARFAKLRQRAIDAGASKGEKLVVTNEPYILGEDEGFDPEIKIERPSLEDVLVLQQAMQRADIWSVATTLLGTNQAIRVVRALDEEGDTNAAEQIFTGLLIDVMEHFYGADAFGVSGGFTLSR